MGALIAQVMAGSFLGILLSYRFISLWRSGYGCATLKACGCGNA